MSGASQRATIRAGLVTALDAKLVDELLDAHAEAKTNYYEGGLRLSAVEGGRFCEAAFRLLEQRTTGHFTFINKQLKTDALILQLAGISPMAQPDSVRLHIPRALRVVYDIRNKRDAAHLADGIDPNKQDATLVIGVLDWVLAEFVRLYHSVSANEAQGIVESLVERRAPAVQAFGDFLKVLNPKLRVADRTLLLLYQCGSTGASLEQLRDWVKPSMRSNLPRTLLRLEHDLATIHLDESVYKITETGIRDVERRRLTDPAS